MLSLAEAKEKILMALSARKLVERGWLTALLGYLAKREELSVRLKYIWRLKITKEGFWGLGNIYILCHHVLARAS